MKSAFFPSRAFSSARQRRFLYAPCLQNTVVRCWPLRAFCDKTCHTGGICGTVSSPPLGSLVYPARGSAHSEPRGWSYLISPQTPLHQAPEPQHIYRERDPVSLGLSGCGWVGGGGGGSLPVTPSPHRVDSDGASAATLIKPPPCTLGIPASSAVSPGRLVTSSLYTACMILRTSGQVHGMACMPCWPSSLCLSLGRPGQRGQ